MNNPDQYLQRIQSIHAELGIAQSYSTSRNIPLQHEANDCELIACEQDRNGKLHRLTKQTSANWQKMQHAAQQQNIVLLIDSGFRSVDYQKQLIEKKLAQGTSLDETLAILAAPGYSEHHTGRAIDIGTPGLRPCMQDFENTDAFLWLKNNAQQFGFTMSYPRNNQFGFIYEPWHWAYHE